MFTGLLQSPAAVSLCETILGSVCQHLPALRITSPPNSHHAVRITQWFLGGYSLLLSTWGPPAVSPHPLHS